MHLCHVSFWDLIFEACSAFEWVPLSGQLTQLFVSYTVFSFMDSSMSSSTFRHPFTWYSQSLPISDIVLPKFGLKIGMNKSELNLGSGTGLAKSGNCWTWFEPEVMWLLLVIVTALLVTLWLWQGGTRFEPELNWTELNLSCLDLWLSISASVRVLHGPWV